MFEFLKGLFPDRRELRTPGHLLKQPNDDFLVGNDPDAVIALGGPGFSRAIEIKFRKRIDELNEDEINEIRRLQGWGPIEENWRGERR